MGSQTRSPATTSSSPDVASTELAGSAHAVSQRRGNAFAAEALAANQQGEQVAAAKARVDATLQQVETFAVPAWDGAVGALDAPSALAAAQLAVSLMREASTHTAALRTLDLSAADTSEGAVSERWGIVAAFLSPQRFAGTAVLGTYEWAPRADETDVAREAGTVVELLATACQVRELLASGDENEADQALGLSDGWRGRPVNFAFLSRALEAGGVLEQLQSVACATGRSFTEQAALAEGNAATFGAMTDVGGYDDAEVTKALDRSVMDWAVTDADALTVYDRVMGASPEGREAILRHLEQSGRLSTLCENLPGTAVSELAGAVSDPHLRSRIASHREESGPSLSEVYDDQTLTNFAEDDPLDAYGWQFLRVAHNAFTGGFLEAHDAAWIANRDGYSSDDGYWSDTTLAAGKAATIIAAGAVTGGAAGAWGEGLALGVGATRASASIVGGALGGAAGGVGGLAAGDVYGQALQGQEGFSSAQDYALAAGLGAGAGAFTAFMAGVPAQTAAALQKYAKGTTGAYRDQASSAASVLRGSGETMALAYARKYPGLDNLLTRLRNAGVRSGLTLAVTAQELSLLARSGLVADAAAIDAALARWSAVAGNERVDISKPLSKVHPQSEVEALYGPVDAKTGRPASLPDSPTARGYAASADDLAPLDRSTDAGVRESVGIDGSADWYAKYKDPKDPLFEVVFKTNVELDAPLPQDDAAPGQLLGTLEGERMHLAGTGRTPSGAREGKLPPGAPIEILEIRPIGDARAAWPRRGSASFPADRGIGVRSLHSPLGTTASAAATPDELD